MGEAAEACSHAETARQAAEDARAMAAAALLEAEGRMAGMAEALTVAETRAALLETNAASAQAAVTEARQHADEAVTRLRATHAADWAGLVDAARAVLVDALGRMVRREADNARRKRATPEKLREWIGQYYATHEAELWVQALTPAVGVHLALTGQTTDAAEAARALVARHMDTSQRELRAVAAADPDEYQAALDRLLQTWEATRAAATVAGYTQEAIVYVRSL